jgi:hypothetical protein
MTDKEKAKADLLEWIKNTGMSHGEDDMNSYILSEILYDPETLVLLLNNYIESKN